MTSTTLPPKTFEVYEKLEDFLDNAAVGIHLVDGQGKILYANNAELAMLGYKAEEYIGHDIREFHSEKSVIEDMLTRLGSKEDILNHSSTLRCKNGSFREVIISSNVHWKEEEFIHTRCFTRDVTQLRKVEKLLRFINKASEELTATHDTGAALDKIINMIVPSYADWFTIDFLKEDGSIELLKMAHADPAKLEWANKYRVDNPIILHDKRPDSFGQVLETGEAVLISEVTNEMLQSAARNEEHLKVLCEAGLHSVMITPMINKGKVVGVVSFISCTDSNTYDENDLSFARDFANRIALTVENIRLYEAVQLEVMRKTEEARKKDEFMSIASHELKTPVTSLKAYAQILQMMFEKREDVQAADMLGKMNKQIDRLTSLITELLDITRIDKGQMRFEENEFEFNGLVDEMAEEMQRASSTHKIQVNKSKPVTVKGDRNRLGQVMVNLISNAIKYSPEATDINVNSRVEDDKVIFSVRDTGIGIPAKEQSRIFQRFFRVMSNEKHYTFPGLGLGLFVSSEIIRRHGGVMKFTSKEGEGSEFWFELPGIKK